ncbi:Transmembrane protein 9 [Fasciola hepatica]|uniref:Transmembrane protein 9 n=1 Tax=Fasciola hepatica TaxID=6192 RepID=A0A4E0R7H7_FASHE|nr:Transmembrane protein 9 [Fasciola hepatica]
MRVLAVLTVVLFLVSLPVEAAYEDARCKCIGFDRSSGPNGTLPTKKIYVKAVPADKCTCKIILGAEDALFPNCECTYQVRNTTTIKLVVCLILVIISALTLYMLFLLLLEPLLSARRANRDHILTSDSRDTGIGSDSAFGGRGVAAGIVSSSLARLTRSRLPDLSLKRPWTQFTTSGTGHPKSAGMAVVWGRSRLSAEQLLDSENASSGSLPNEGKLRQRVAKPDAFPSTSDPQPTVANVVSRVKDQQQRWKGNVEAQRARVFGERSLLN